MDMGNNSSRSPNWGGRRENAGRPKQIGEETAKVSVRLDAATAEKCKALGGSAFIRGVIKAAVEKDAKLAELSLRKQETRRIPGLFPVRRESMARVQTDSRESTVPAVAMSINCGSPLPAPDPSAEAVSLSDLMIRHPETTFIASATGDSMLDAGICEGDTIILDRGLEPRNSDIVLAFLNGELTLKRLKFVQGRPELHPENEEAAYPIIKPSEYDDLQILGVLVGICRRYR